MHLDNSKVHFSVVEIQNRQIILCYSRIGSFKLIYFEDLETKQRKVINKTFSSESDLIDVLNKLVNDSSN